MSEMEQLPNNLTLDELGIIYCRAADCATYEEAGDFPRPPARPH